MMLSSLKHSLNYFLLGSYEDEHWERSTVSWGLIPHSSRWFDHPLYWDMALSDFHSPWIHIHSYRWDPHPSSSPGNSKGCHTEWFQERNFRNIESSLGTVGMKGSPADNDKRIVWMDVRAWLFNNQPHHLITPYGSCNPFVHPVLI